MFHVSVPFDQVVFTGGIYVRDSPSIDDGKLVRVEPFGAVLNATGKVCVCVRYTYRERD